jgi:PAS domain S-box-containing protein
MLHDQPLPASTAADGMPRWMTLTWLAVLVGSVYILSAKLSLSLLTPEGVAVFWPAAGVAAGALIVLGPSARWAVVAGAMAATIGANLMGDRNLPSAFVFAVCNAGEAVLAAGLIERYFGSPFQLDRLSHVLGLVGVAVVATAVSGIGGMLGFAAFHGATSLFTTWQNWFASDALGIVTIAPVVIGLASLFRDPPGQSETFEGLLALALLIVMSVIVITLPREIWATVVPIALLFPVLLWIAARCRPFFAAGAAFIVTLAIVWTTTIGVGHFGAPGVPMEDRVLAARAGILAVALCAYVLAALFAERRQQEAALADSEARLQEALKAGAVTTFVLDVATGVAQRSANAAEVLGFGPQRDFSARDFLARVHPDDRPGLEALIRGVTPDRPGYTATFRFEQADGREVWLEETAKAEFDALGQAVSFKGLTLDVTARKRSEDQRSVLVAALDQGVGNLLARVATVARDARRGGAPSEEDMAALDRRIGSMAKACELLGRNRWESVDLADLVRRLLAPHGTDANTTVSGPAVMLSVPETQALAMVVHELVTNAVKYGALSTPHGRIEVTWSRETVENASRLSIGWREIRGPRVPEAPSGKYGTSVIRNLIPTELGGAVALDFPSDGVRCQIEIPLDGARGAVAGTTIPTVGAQA